MVKLCGEQAQLGVDNMEMIIIRTTEKNTFLFYQKPKEKQI